MWLLYIYIYDQVKKMVALCSETPANDAMASGRILLDFSGK
jgi:hypothetical protein